MSFSARFLLSGCLACIFCGQVRAFQPQPPPSRTAVAFLDQEMYDRVLNLVFPPLPEVKKGILLALAIRFLSAHEPEMQIAITLGPGSDATVELSSADRNVD